MKVKELLEYESFVTKKKTPSDMMNEGDLNLHWSESKGEHIDLVDMDLVHLIRSYSKCLDGHKNDFDSRFHVQEIVKKIKEQIIEIESIIDKSE